MSVIEIDESSGDVEFDSTKRKCRRQRTVRDYKLNHNAD